MAPLADLAQRRSEALERLAAEAQERVALVDRAQGAIGVGSLASGGIVGVDKTGLAQVSDSAAKLHSLAQTAYASIPKTPKPPVGHDFSAALDDLKAEAEAAGEVLAQERRETVEREERMVAALEASQQALAGVLQTLRTQEEQAAQEERWQHAIYAMGVLTLVSGLCVGNALSSSWWAALVGGGVALALSLSILMLTGLVRPRGKSASQS